MGLVSSDPKDKPVEFGQKETADTPPKRPRGRPKGSGVKEPITPPTRDQVKETRQIEETLAKVLSMPGIVFALNGDEYCAKHYEETAPELAKQLANASLRYPKLRAYFLGVPQASENLALFAAILAYLYAPLAHHVPGIPRLPALQILGVPVPPEDELGKTEVVEEPIVITRKLVLEALIEEKESGVELTEDAEQMIRNAGFGELLDERESIQQAHEASQNGSDTGDSITDQG